MFIFIIMRRMEMKRRRDPRRKSIFLLKGSVEGD
jgi:hypothetical protein